MDEINQQTGSDTVLKDSPVGESEASVKGIADEEPEEALPKKTCSEASSNLIEPLNANGMDKDSETYPGDTLQATDLEFPESHEEKTFNDCVCNKSNSEINVTSETVDNSVKEHICKQTDSEIYISSKDSGNVDSSRVESSNKSDVSECHVNRKEDLTATDRALDDSESHVVGSKGDCKLVDISGINDCSKYDNNQDVTTSAGSHEEGTVVEKEVPDVSSGKISQLTGDSSENSCNEKEAVGSSNEAVNQPETVIPSKEVVEDITVSKNTENENNSSEFNSLTEKCSNEKDTACSEINEMTEEQSKGTEEVSPKPESPNKEGSGEEEQISRERPFIQEASSGDNIQANHEWSKGPEEGRGKPCLQSKESNEEEQISLESEHAEGSSNTEVEETAYQQNKEAESPGISQEDLPKEQQASQEDQLTVQSTDEMHMKSQEIEDLCEIGRNESADKEDEISGAFPLDVDSDSETINPQEEKKSDDAEYSESSQNPLKNDINDSNNLNQNFEIKSGNAQDCSSDQIVNSSSANVELEEESINKNANDGNEMMDTELVNCKEIEQVDINENEADLKSDGRDEEMVGDSLDTVGDKNNEDQLTDAREIENEAEKNEILIDEDEDGDGDGVNQPGNSEEETITGDTTNQSSSDLAKEKDEEVCIIPDDMIPALSILPKNKSSANTEGEGEGLKILKESHLELEKPKTRAQDKKSQASDCKPRPVRNAAKLAGNKIKSLVENDLVYEEQGSGGDVEEEMVVQENDNGTTQICAHCREVKVCKLLSVQNDTTHYLCSEQCLSAFKTASADAEPIETESTLRDYVRKCSQCHAQIKSDETRLFWETMDFCNEDCLGKYQLELGSNCANCKKSVPSTSLGKYCVRFGYDIKQFCSAVCLEEYKKGLKVCSYCQKDISTGVEGFLAPVGTKGQFKDFCTQSCMEKYDRMSSNKPLPDIIEECAVCSNSKPVQVEVELDNKTHKLCSEPCFAAFKFVNNITEGQCDMCRKYFDRSKIPKFSLRLLFYDETLHSFCSKTCMNVYILANRKIVPCNWCKVKKYNFDMIRKISSDGQLSMMCSLNCLMLYQTSVNAVCSRPIKCDFCKKKFVRQPLYHLTMSDATLRNFCSYNCVMSFQNGYPKQKIDVIPGPDQLISPTPTGGPKRLAPKRPQVESTCVPVISSVQSLASPNGPVSPSSRVTIPRGDVNLVPQVGQPLAVQASVAPMPAPPPPQVYQQVIIKPAPAKQMKNKSVLCKPYSHTKGVSCRPHPCMKETQTDQSLNRKFLIPIPVPIYVPAPMHMFSAPFPVPVPFPLPIPVPIFIPTTRNSAKGIMKEIKKIQEKIPTDPFEAELLMMAEMVAGEKKQDPTDSESEDGNDGDDNGDGTFSPENVDTSNTFGDDMLQMALKMASELEEPAVDMESVLTSNTITTSTQPAVDPNKTLYASDTDDPDQVNVMAMNRGRKRSVRGSRNSTGGTPSKRGRRTSGSVDVPLLSAPEPVPPRTIEVEKPDANMCLKYTFGVNAWRHWVMQKNAELEKAALTNRKIKLFKPELLQLTADELNFSLCLFVKEVRKPNGTEYAPDTIYYLCLGIQQYLFENGRIDNIFTDSYYEKFTDCLDEVAKKFAALYNDSQYIVTRVEEEHLWESKQLGAHSPHVLLSTLMFFNTKHFNLVTVEEHMQLSFSHIMKHWKRNPNTPGVAKVPGSRNVLLRFYPPQSALEANSRKKKVYEQQENEENPLRCPVKLYEFYLSKCPESVKTRNDVFYLLPERSCVPDSPVWYSTMALGKEPLMKMLHRIKMVKEINIALLTS